MLETLEENKSENGVSEEDIIYLNVIEKATFDGFSALIDPVTEFPVDIASIEDGDLERNPKDPYLSKTSPTNIALGFLYLLLAYERGYLSWVKAYERALRMFGMLRILETFEGFHYNWYYLSGEIGKVPEVTLNRFVSSVDNGNLDIVLMTVAEYFRKTTLAKRIHKLLGSRDYRFFFNKNPGNPDSQMMNLGYDAEKEHFSNSDYSIFNTEGRMMVLISILKDHVSESAWKKQARLVRSYKTREGENIPVVAPWGGSLFEGLFADEILGGDRIAPKAFRLNALNLIRIHQDYGKLMSETGIWGISNGEVPGENRYEMAGVREIAYSQFPSGFVTLYSSFLALKYDPKGVIENLRKIEALNPDSFHPNFGFVESVDPGTGVINRNILSLDKGMECLALGNFLNSIDKKKKTSDYFQDYLKNCLWHQKAEKLLRGEEHHPSFLALSDTVKRVKRVHASFVIYILGLEREIRAFRGEEKAKAEFEIVGGERDKTLCVLYDVKEHNSFSGISFRMSEIGIEPFENLLFKLKGNEELGIPKTLKVELKWKGTLIQFGHFSVTKGWHQESLPCPAYPRKLDEISFVFENSAVGEDWSGEIFIQDLALQ